MSKIPVYTAVRLIPRESEYLDRKSGSKGEIFFDRDTNSLRLYNGITTGGISLVTTVTRDGSIDLPAIQKNKIRFHWDTLTDLQTEVNPVTYHGMIAHVHSEGRLYFAHSGEWVPVANLSEAGGGSGGGTSNAFTTITVPGQNNIVASANDILNFEAGAGITLTTNATTDTITITSTSTGNAFTTISGDTGSATPDSSTDTLTFIGGTNITTAVNSSTDTVTINLDSFPIEFLSNVSAASPVSGQVLKWDGAQWAPAADIASGGAGLDADTLDGFTGSYYLDYNNFVNTPSTLTLTSISVGPEDSPSGNGAISYNNSTGVFSFTPPDLSSYLTSVSFAQLTATPTTISGYGITDSFDGDFDSLTNKPTTLLGYGITDTLITPNNVSQYTFTGFGIGADDSTIRNISSGESIKIIGGINVTTTSDEEGNITINATPGGGEGEANQNAFSNIAVSGQSTIAADTTTDTLTIVGGTNITVQTDISTDTLTISTTASSTFSGLTDSTSTGLTVDQIYLPAITSLTVTNVGASAYLFDQYTGNNPTIYAINGTTIAFKLNAPSHPFLIQNGAGVNYNTGLVHVTTTGTVTTGAAAQGKDSGTLYWKIPSTISGGYRYQCGSHGAMVGSITIKDFVSI
jgi:hypothetical protein